MVNAAFSLNWNTKNKKQKTSRERDMCGRLMANKKKMKNKNPIIKNDVDSIYRKFISQDEFETALCV